MRFAGLVIGALVLVSGCATKITPEVQLRLDQIAATREAPATSGGVFTLENKRDPDATRGRIVPLGIAGGFSCNLGVEQFGDAVAAGDRLARLESALATAFPDRRPAGQLIVRRYDIYFNHSAETNQQSWNAALGGGILVPLIAPVPGENAPKVVRRPRCERDRMKGGWFETADLINNAPPFTLDLDVTVFGHDYTVNAAQSPEINFLGLGVAFNRVPPTASGAVEATIQKLMRRAELRLIESVRKDVAASETSTP